MNTAPLLPPESAVQSRYAAAARTPEAALCCPVNYRPELLKIIPQEVLDTDYGCGDPSRHVQPGETVLDLGCGAGKICFIAAQIVGPHGRVIGVDMTDAMLEVARRNAPHVANRLGYANVAFHKGRIQDLALDLDALDAALRDAPINGADAYLRAEHLAAQLRARSPLIPSESVDVVVSNCVLNLIEPSSKIRLFDEIFRVLKRGGRAVISDIVSDEPVPAHLQANPELWSGCVSGALTETAFLEAFEQAGFYGIQTLEFTPAPWRIVENIEFRSMTVRAFKGKQGPCFEHRQAAIYLGPFREVLDDDGHRLQRGQRHAICDKTYQLYSKAPYREHFALISPPADIYHLPAQSFDCSAPRLRHPKETKGQSGTPLTPASQCCNGGNCTP